MFSMQIVDTDAFLDMPQSSQLLYFHLSMRADDDGFVSNPKKIMKVIGSNDDDLKVLFVKRFTLPFESGVCVIKHWKIHNYIQSDRYTPTQYVKEKSMLKIDPETKKYQLKQGENSVLDDDVHKMDTQVRLELELGKVRLEEEATTEAVFTPQQISEKFFSDPSEQERVISEIVSNGVRDDIARREIGKFVGYWIELNPTGKKRRWQMQKTFEVQRRLGTWFRNVSGFEKKADSQTRGMTIVT